MTSRDKKSVTVNYTEEADRKQKFTADFDGSPIKPGYVMVPYEYQDLESEAYTNPECIDFITKNGVSIKVVYKATPAEWAKAGKSQVNLVQNELLGHYQKKDTVSSDALQDEYGLEHGSAESPEDMFVKQETWDENIRKFKDLSAALIEQAPKLGYAVLLVRSHVKGQEFYRKMRLTGTPANHVRQSAEQIVKDGIGNIDIGSIRMSRSKHDNAYREEAYELLNTIIEMF